MTMTVATPVGPCWHDSRTYCIWAFFSKCDRSISHHFHCQMLTAPYSVPRGNIATNVASIATHVTTSSALQGLPIFGSVTGFFRARPPHREIKHAFLKDIFYNLFHSFQGIISGCYGVQSRNPEAAYRLGGRYDSRLPNLPV
jgi:hypothetical protein